MRTLKKIFLVTALACLPVIGCAADTAVGLLAAGRVDDAISTLQQKISGSPNDADSYNLLCRAYFALGSWDPGVSACEKAVALAPNNSEYHLWLGRIYGEKADASSFFTAAGLAKKVRTEFETAVRLKPDDVGARTDLAEFYLEAPGIVGGGRDKAEAQAQTLSTMDAAKAHWVIARIAEKKKDMAAAEREYRASIESSHGSAESWLDLAIFFRHANRFDDMEDAIRHASTAPMKQPVVLVDSAETLIRAERNYPMAVQLLRRYLDSNTVEEAPAFKAHYLLGTALEKQGDKAGAAKEYRTALSLARNFSLAQEALNRVAH
jgi:cytochrome c-type biogenesis protein CcmH/NrfG